QRLRSLPPPARAPAPVRRLALGRRAADARDRSRADVQSPGAADGRAVRGPGPPDRGRGHGHDSPAEGAGAGDRAGRAERAAGLRGGRRRRHPQQRPGGVRGSGGRSARPGSRPAPAPRDLLSWGARNGPHTPGGGSEASRRSRDAPRSFAREARPRMNFRAFRHRDFRLFLGGQLVSMIGTWMQSVGQAWLVLELTRSPLSLGLVSALQFLPVLFLSPVGGALSDRFAKRRVLLVTQSVMMLQAFVLAVLVGRGHVRYWHVAVLATIYGLGRAVDIPARQSFVTDLVGKPDLPNAVALNSI